MVADYPHGISGGHLYRVRSVTVRMESLRTSKSRLQEPLGVSVTENSVGVQKFSSSLRKNPELPESSQAKASIGSRALMSELKAPRLQTPARGGEEGFRFG